MGRLNTFGVRRVARKVLDAKTSVLISRITPRLKGYPDNALRNNPKSCLAAAQLGVQRPISRLKEIPKPKSSAPRKYL